MLCQNQDRKQLRLNISVVTIEHGLLLSDLPDEYGGKENVMGQFSWLDCKTGEQVLDNVERDVYLLVPKEFGGGHIEEHLYDGYGRFGGRDAYGLVAQWNAPDRCIGNDEADRYVGIEIACYDEQNAALRFPIKITHDPDAVYEDCRPSPNDPNQGWLMEDDAEEYDEYEEW